MKRRMLIVLTALAVLLGLGSPALALLDQFVGDSAIYSASSQYLRPNVLLVIDNSAGMRQAGSRDPYNPATDYSKLPDGSDWGAPYLRYKVYERKAGTGGVINYVQYINDVNVDVTCVTARNALLANGFYAGALQKNGTCSGQPGNFYLGNLLNYINYPSTTPVWEPNKAYPAGARVRPITPILDSNGVPLEYEALTPGTSNATEPTWPTTVGTTYKDGAIEWAIAGSILDMVRNTVKQVVAGARESVNFGVMVFGDNNHGGSVLVPVRQLGTTDPDDPATALFDNGPTNFTALNTAVNNLTLLNANAQRVNETLWDAYLYFGGLNSSSTKISSERTAYPTPIKYGCQKNFIILLTTGATNDISLLKSYVGDIDGDGALAGVDDSAKLLYESDLLTSIAGDQRIQTHIIQLLTPRVDELAEAVDPAHGRGAYFKVNNSNELTTALLNTMANIVLESDTSFVAPVVPTSPENRTYSGERVYLGFFKPISQMPWYGNLKKYGINHANEIIDRNGYVATLDDGSFSASASSFWSTTNDAGKVEEGGAGELLLSRDFSTDPRQIYTNRGVTSDLTDSSNAFDATNIAPADVGVADNTARDNLVNYIYGFDAYDDDGDANTTEKRDWILGDILHSKPQIINYNTYPFSAGNEADPTTNKTMIFVGTNDGMLHAFRDADGKELWAFIPDAVRPNLSELGQRPAEHTYFVDSSPAVYTFDKDGDGNIGASEAADADPDDGSYDKVVIMFGLRRGGNAYYALDVTNPEAPVLLWKISPSTAGFQWLGETWSEPQLGKVKIGTVEKIVAFVGGGYDTIEDARYGNTYLVESATPVSSQGAGNVANTAVQWIDLIDDDPDPLVTRYHWQGKAVYAIEVATLSSGIPDLSTSGSQVWKFDSGVQANSYYLWYAIPSDITVLDSNFDGYVDRLYVGDLGGRMWRFDVGDTSTANWTGKIIYYVNSGEKIFYRPSVTLESGYTFVFFGTGDREHPLNRHSLLKNRMVALKDRNQDTFAVGPANLLDVTSNLLQTDTATAAQISTALTTLNSSTNYGWYIFLDGKDRDPVNGEYGEKVLASPLAFNKVAYYTTYTPNAVVSADPCQPGNLGKSRLYAMNYKTGEAILNFYKANDSSVDSVTNLRAVNKQRKVLRRIDRSIDLGVGIPSGLVVPMPPGGDAVILIGCGGGLCSEDPLPGGTIIPIYWMQW